MKRCLGKRLNAWCLSLGLPFLAVGAAPAEVIRIAIDDRKEDSAVIEIQLKQPNGQFVDIYNSATAKPGDDQTTNFMFPPRNGDPPKIIVEDIFTPLIIRTGFDYAPNIPLPVGTIIHGAVNAKGTNPPADADFSDTLEWRLTQLKGGTIHAQIDFRSSPPGLGVGNENKDDDLSVPAISMDNFYIMGEAPDPITEVVEIGSEKGNDVSSGQADFLLNFKSDTPEPSTLVLSSILFGMFGLVWSYKRFRQATVVA